MSSLGLSRDRVLRRRQRLFAARLQGLEPGFTDHALDRAIVMHGAPLRQPGSDPQAGQNCRSWGCPAVRPAVARRMIDTLLKHGALVFAYYPTVQWLRGIILPAVRLDAGRGAVARAR